MRSALFAVPLVGAAVLFAVLASALFRGLDLTDEAYYLLWMERPASYRMSSTFFGFALHPLYVLLGGSIGGLRVSGAAITAVLGAGALVALLRGAGPRCRLEAYPRRDGLTTATTVAATLPLIYFAYWWPMPSYNWLPLAAGLLLVCSIGMMLKGSPSWTSAATAAIAGVVALLGKVTAASFFATVYIASAILLTTGRREAIHQISYAAALTATLLLATAFFLPLDVVSKQITAHIELFGFGAIAARDVLSDLLSFAQSLRGATFLTSWAALLASLARYALIASLLSAASIAMLIWLVSQGNLTGWIGSGVTVLTLLLLAGWTWQGGNRRTILALGLLCLLPWAASAGTSNDIANQTLLYAGIPGIIGLMATIVITERLPLARFVALCAWLVVPSLSIAHGMRHPYRLATPVYGQTESAYIRGARLSLDPNTKRFVSELQRAGHAYGFCPQTPIVDLTGELPAVAYILNGSPPGFPWLPGGYPFSMDLARAMLETVDSAILRQAWLVTGEGRIAFSPQFVRSMGFELDQDYTVVAELRHPIYGTPVKLHRPTPQGRGARC